MLLRCPVCADALMREDTAWRCPVCADALLAMTPHYWRIGREGAARAAALTRLEDAARMELYLWRREG